MSSWVVKALAKGHTCSQYRDTHTHTHLQSSHLKRQRNLTVKVNMVRYRIYCPDSVGVRKQPDRGVYRRKGVFRLRVPEGWESMMTTNSRPGDRNRTEGQHLRTQTGSRENRLCSLEVSISVHRLAGTGSSIHCQMPLGYTSSLVR